MGLAVLDIGKVSMKRKQSGAVVLLREARALPCASIPERAFGAGSIRTRLSRRANETIEFIVTQPEITTYVH